MSTVLSPEQQQALMQQIQQQIQQGQINAWNQDLSSGGASQQGAQQAAQGIQNLGGQMTSNPMYSTPNGSGLTQQPFSFTPTASPASNPVQAQALSPNPALFQNTPDWYKGLTGTTGAQPRSMMATNSQTGQAGTQPGASSNYVYNDAPLGPGAQMSPAMNPQSNPQATFGMNPTGGIQSGDYNSAVGAMMGGGQPNTTSPGMPPQAAGVQGPTGTIPPNALSQPPGQVDQTNGLSYASQPGNFPTGTPMVPNAFSPQFTQDYQNFTGNTANQIGQQWQNAPWGSMNAAQMNTGQVPQVNAQTPQSFAALQFLLSGQGFDPATLARMNANATDQISQSEAGTMDAARLAAQRAGLLNSGAGIGLQANVANQAGIQQGQALNNIQIANAQQGIQNLTQGAGMNLNLQENAAQQANQVALQNAANMFSAMTQNLSNQQATNAANFAGQQQKALGQAQAQSGYTGNAGQNYQNAQTGQYYGANTTNANIGNQQWGTAGGWLNNLATYGAPNANTANTSAAAATNPNTALGTAATGLGTGLTSGTKPTGT